MILVFSIEEDNSTSDVLDWIDPFFRISKFGSSEYQHLQCGKKTVLLQPLNIYLCRLNKPSNARKIKEKLAHCREMPTFAT